MRVGRSLAMCLRWRLGKGKGSEGSRKGLVVRGGRSCVDILEWDEEGDVSIGVSERRKAVKACIPEGERQEGGDEGVKD